MAFKRSKENCSTKNKHDKIIVNTTTPYEDLMAAKLEQIPVPDMADRIWAGIDAQLDVVTSLPEEKPPFKYKGKTAYSIAGITLLVAVILWWYYHQQHHTVEKALPQKTAPAIQQAPAIPDSQILMDQFVKKNTPVIPITVKKDSLLLNSILNTDEDSINKDISVPNFFPATPDSVLLPGKNIPDRIFDTIYTLPKYPKPKGVKGITNDDYKISARQDSIRK
jgi:hypothetical protein